LTSPKLAQDTDNGRYYRDPYDGAMVPSVTNVLNEWSIPALAPGAAKETAAYVVDRLPKAVRASRRRDTREEFLKEAQAHYKTVWEKKADLGTRVHAIADAHNLGKPVPHDEQAAPYVAQYEQFLADFGVNLAADVECSETTVFRRGEPRYAGTADLWVHLHFPAATSEQDPRWRGRLERTRRPVPTPSGLWKVDIKTSMTKPASAVYRDHLLQLAALRYADVAVMPDDSEIKIPQFVGAAILNLRADSYGFVPLPADERMHAAFLHLVEVALVAHQIDLAPCKPVVAPHTKKGAA
jgi:hypothetical protein